jgi:hypothetical protein
MTNFNLSTIAFCALAALGEGHACSCISYGFQLDSLATKSIVFAGKVKRIEPLFSVDTNATVFRTGQDSIRYVFEVERAFKGVSGLEVPVFVRSTDGASCGLTFDLDSSYFIGYTPYNGIDAIWINLCSFSPKITAANRDSSYAVVAARINTANVFSRRSARRSPLAKRGSEKYRGGLHFKADGSKHNRP